MQDFQTIGGSEWESTLRRGEREEGGRVGEHVLGRESCYALVLSHD